MEFLIRHKTIIAFVSFFLFCIISLSVKSSAFTFSVEGIGSAMVSPFQKGYNLVQGGMQKLWAGFFELNEIREQLESTRKKLEQYENTAEDIREMKIENESLRTLHDFQAKVEYDSVAAEVISKDPDNWFRTIIINKGSKHGIQVNMPVIAFNGEEKAVIGKVVEVRRSLSRIIPIISTDMKLGVMLQESRSPGLMQGYSSNSDLCVIDYINKAEKITPGTRIVTSGQCSVFPKGLPVGEVVTSQMLKSSAFQKAIIKPFIDYNKIEQVFVIMKLPDPEFIELLNSEVK